MFKDIDTKALLLEMAHNSRRMANTFVDIEGVRYDFFELLRDYLYPENAGAKVNRGL